MKSIARRSSIATVVLCAVVALWVGARNSPLLAAQSGRPPLDFTAVFAQAGGGQIAPCRAIADPYPTFTNLALDPKNHLAVISDNGMKSALVYALDAGRPNESDITPYLAQIKGEATHIASPAGVALDPVNHRIYVADNDIGESLGSFPYGANGNYPVRDLAVPVGAWGIGLNPARGEEAVSEEDQALIIIYRLGASGGEHPLREIRGPHSGLADPYGLYWDTVNHEIAVANHGDWNRGYWDDDYNGGGHYNPPSIEAFDDGAKGDAAPKRIIQGPHTQLNWPFQLAVDTVHNEIAVANLGSDSILIFKRTAAGNAAPLRVIHGPHTGLRLPMGVGFDPVNNELWVANYGHEAMIFERTAEGDATPKRIIRSAPEGSAVVGISNPFNLTFDSRRNQLLVRN